MALVHKNHEFQRKSIYKDFDLSFSRHPLTNDVGVKTDANAINQSIRNLLNTSFYERSFHPEIGSNIREILFEPADAITINDLKISIRNIIGNYEPRATLIDLIVTDNSEKNAYGVMVVYRINLEREPITLNVVLKRLR